MREEIVEEPLNCDRTDPSKVAVGKASKLTKKVFTRVLPAVRSKNFRNSAAGDINRTEKLSVNGRFRKRQSHQAVNDCACILVIASALEAGRSHGR